LQSQGLFSQKNLKIRISLLINFRLKDDGKDNLDSFLMKNAFLFLAILE